MQNSKIGALIFAAGFSASALLAPSAASAQDQVFDHLTCVRVNRDERFAKMPPPLTLTSQQTELLSSDGCKPVGGGKIARAEEICYPSAKSPGNPPGGTDLSDQSFLCYRVKCAANGGTRTELDVADQFGSGTVFANEKPVTKRLCVPAFIGGAPTPSVTPTTTPTGSPAGTPTATPGATPTATPAPTATASPTSTPAPTATAAATATPTTTPSPTAVPTSTPSPTAVATSTPSPTAVATSTPSPTPIGSANRAFVDPVTDLLH